MSFVPIKRRTNRYTIPAAYMTIPVVSILESFIHNSFRIKQEDNSTRRFVIKCDSAVLLTGTRLKALDHRFVVKRMFRDDLVYGS